MRLIATCPQETQSALMHELTSLGVTEMSPGYRAVAFEASEALFYALHLQLRTASRLLRVIKDVPARTPPMLFSQTRRIAWHELFDARHGFLVECLGAPENAERTIMAKVREGVQDGFARHGLAVPQVDLDNPKV